MTKEEWLFELLIYVSCRILNPSFVIPDPNKTQSHKKLLVS